MSLDTERRATNMATIVIEGMATETDKAEGGGES